MGTFQDGVEHAAPWMTTTSGRRVYLLAPTPDSIDLDDITLALSRLVRFTGHGTEHPWTIAQHSVVVGEIAQLNGLDRQLCRCALLHDATEAYIADVNRPLKQSMRLLADGPSPYDVIEARLWAAIAVKFDLPDIIPAEVAECDNQALHIEADLLFGAGTGRSWGLPEPSTRMGPPIAADVVLNVKVRSLL